MKYIHLSISLPPEANSVLRELAERRGMSISATIRQAVGIMQAMDVDTRAGKFVGATRDREALETVIVSPL